MHHDAVIDLSVEARRRVLLSPEQVLNARRLVEMYYRDLDGSDDMVELTTEVAKPFLHGDYWDELEALAEAISMPVGHVLLCNVYYDLIKPLTGCTAFAVDSAAGPLHARNLDWWTDNNLLSSATSVQLYKGNSLGDFFSVGWPGYLGVMSGFAPGRFSITLNAVISDEQLVPAMPISYRIRKTFETMATFTDAVDYLSSQPIPSDCLLLIVGTKPGEMAVIERTPTRSAIRRSDTGWIAVANGYVALEQDSLGGADLLQETSGGRYARICSLLERNCPASMHDCFHYLRDHEVRMSITVQQMAFQPASGAAAWQRP